MIFELPEDVELNNLVIAKFLSKWKVCTPEYRVDNSWDFCMSYGSASSLPCPRINLT